MDRSARTVELKIHPAKIKRTTVKSRSRKPVPVRGKELEEVQDFKYLGSFISANSNIDREVSSRVGQAAQAFKRLSNILKSTTLHTRTKLKIYKTNVRSVLLHAAETWRTNRRLDGRVRGLKDRLPLKNPSHLVGAKGHQQRSLEAGRHQRHRPTVEDEALEMPWPCTSHEEGPPSICSTGMGST